MLLDFAARAFESDIALRVLTPRTGPLLAILNDIGVPAHVVGASRAMLRGSQRGAGLATAPRALGALYRWAGRLRAHPFIHDADVVYSLGFKPHLATARLRHCPAVWHLHEFPPTLTGPFWRSLSRRTATALIANSRAVGQAWDHRRGSATPPVHVVLNGVDLDRFRPRDRTGWIHEQLGLPHDHRLVGMPAVLARWKGQLLVLDAFARVAPRHLDVHLVFVGGSIYDTVAESRYEADLRKAIARCAAVIGSRVHLVPFQAKVEAIYPELDLAVHYSTRAEAFGRVVLEAMSCGTPVIAAAEGGPTEVVTDGGWLVPPRAPATLAEALDAALRLSPAERKQIGFWGRTRAEDAFSARRFARAVADVLWEVGERR